MSSVQSVERAFTILRCLAGGPAGVSEVAERVDLPKSTVSRLLSTLHDFGAVEQSDTGTEYRVGHAIREIADGALPGSNLVTVVRPHLMELVDALGEAAGLSVLDGRELLYLDQVSADNPVQVEDWTGERLDAHRTSSGLVLLALLPERERERYLSGHRTGGTAHTPFDPEDLRKRLDRIAVNRIEWTCDEFIEGISSVAAPVTGIGGRVVAAIHVHGPSYRFPASGTEAEIVELLLATAARVTARLVANE